ncbi:DUF2946 family protein, partial [Onishia taeanensis]
GPRRRPDRRLAWLALAAMLLIFVGPLISQSQRLAMQDSSAVAKAHSQAQPHAQPQAQAQARAPHQHQAASDAETQEPAD